MSTGVILLAAGSGRRFGGRSPKQLALLNGKPLYQKSLTTFLKISTVVEIAVVTSKELLPILKRQLKRIRTKKKIILTVGGAFRGASVKNGFKALSKSCDIVLVHDAARPMVGAGAIERVIKAARSAGVALAAWPLGDTLKEADSKGQVRRTISRDKLWLAQTPQGFRRDVADKCLSHPNSAATDDVQLAEKKGFKVKIVLGSATNMKVTYPMDLKFCNVIAS